MIRYKAITKAAKLSYNYLCEHNDIKGSLRWKEWHELPIENKRLRSKIRYYNSTYWHCISYCHSWMNELADIARQGNTFHKWLTEIMVVYSSELRFMTNTEVNTNIIDLISKICATHKCKHCCFYIMGDCDCYFHHPVDEWKHIEIVEMIWKMEEVADE